MVRGHVCGGDSTLMHYSAKDITSSDGTGMQLSFKVSGDFKRVGSFLAVLGPILVPVQSIPHIMVKVHENVVPGK